MCLTNQTCNLTMQLLVSFIVPTLDHPAELKRFLCSADRQSVRNFEVVVIDQGASSVEAITAGRPNVRHIHSERKGLSLNRNIGVRQARGDVFVFADDDCVLPEDYVEALNQYVSRLRGNLLFGFGNVLNLEDRQPFVPTFRPPRKPVSAWNCDMLCSVCLVFHRTCFEAVGLFDEDFGVGARYPGGEELDLLLRLIGAGISGEYWPDLTILHPKRSRDPRLVERYEAYGFGQGAVARKHLDKPAYLARYLYSLARPVGGMALAIIRRDDLFTLYARSLRGKLRGFFDYRKR